MQDDGVCGTSEARGYMSRVLRLTLLAPEIAEAILDGRHQDKMRLQGLLAEVPLEWEGGRLRERCRLLLYLPVAEALERSVSRAL